MDKKRIYVVVASAVMILFCIVYAGTYAYFTAGVKDTRPEENKTSTMKTAELQDMSLKKIKSTTSALLIPGESITNEFQIENPSNVTMCFNLVWTNVENTFVNKNDLVVTLEEDGNNITLENNIFPIRDDILKDKLSINAKGEKSYKLTVEYRLTEEDQLADRDKVFNGTIEGRLTNCE